MPLSCAKLRQWPYFKKLLFNIAIIIIYIKRETIPPGIHREIVGLSVCVSYIFVRTQLNDITLKVICLRHLNYALFCLFVLCLCDVLSLGLNVVL